MPIAPRMFALTPACIAVACGGPQAPSATQQETVVVVQAPTASAPVNAEPPPPTQAKAASDAGESYQETEDGLIGLINNTGGSDPNAPTAPWGREDRGTLFADPDSGTGGVGGGIGLGNIGRLGHGADGGVSRAPTVRMGSVSVNGRLPPEVVMRIVRQNFGRDRICYENGLRTNHALAGTVTTKFVIDRAGEVSMTADGGSSMPDQGVVQCVVRGFGNLLFPQPEGGSVTVVVPIVFAP